MTADKQNLQQIQEAHAEPPGTATGTSKKTRGIITVPLNSRVWLCALYAD